MAANSIVNSENSIVNRASFPLPVNYDCLFALYEWLGFKECMNLAEAFDGFQCVADWTYKQKFTEFTYDFEDPIDLVFYHIGPFVQSLKLILDKFEYTENHLKEIRDACEVLKNLSLTGFDRKTIDKNPFRGGIDNLEVLTLDRCSLANDSDFFETFTNLKCLNIIECREIDDLALKKCFEKNVMLTSFVCGGSYRFFPQLLKLLPNLERLSLQYNTAFTSQSFSNFPKLRFLTLHCWGQNTNNILTELAKNKTLEQLELIDVRIDENTLNLINTFQNLELLVVTTNGVEFTSKGDLPPKLKSLKLGGFRITRQQIASLTKQLMHLEDIQLDDCILDNNGVAITYFDSMADLIVQELYTQVQANRKLNMTLTDFGDYPYKITITTGRLRICNYLETSDAFQIMYPGMAD